MPLEIRELVIKVEIQNQKADSDSAIRLHGRLAELKAKVIEECVRKVFDRMKNHFER